MKNHSKIDQLLARGVRMPNPPSVEIGDDVDVHRISATGVTIHAGSKVFGPQTYIGQGARIGYEGPVTIENSFVGPDVNLKGGFFQQAVFLRNASCGLGSHVRQGTILEEGANIAHTVGLKQTILFPFVTLGSLINFCDCLMAGGTDKKNHSEVGSSYIHFNFTPNQDKATPSLMGDVPRGVMLNQSPIFLGGQGGMVGPLRIMYGTVIAAGSICRKDQLKPDRLVIEGGIPNARMPFIAGQYHGLKGLLEKNFYYIGQLTALRYWYTRIRSAFVGPDFEQPLHDGLVATLDLGIDERYKQLDKLQLKLEKFSNDAGNDHILRFCRNWRQVESQVRSLESDPGRVDKLDGFLNEIESGIKNQGRDYLAVIRHLTSVQVQLGTAWLQSIVDQIAAALATCLE